MNTELWAMSEGLALANKAFSEDEVPVGAVILSPYGEVLGSGYNLKEKDKDVTAHAEILCLKQAAKKKGDWRLEDCTMVVTLEPCLMCSSAIQQSRIKKLIFGAYDSKGGALSLKYNVFNSNKLNHKVDVVGGIMQFDCSKILSDFFKMKRKGFQK